MAEGQRARYRGAGHHAQGWLRLEIARELHARRIPFLVYSGRSQQEAAPEFRDVRRLEKRTAHGDLPRALDEARVK
jgi:hypothetical protein